MKITKLLEKEALKMAEDWVRDKIILGECPSMQEFLEVNNPSLSKIGRGFIGRKT